MIKHISRLFITALASLIVLLPSVSKAWAADPYNVRVAVADQAEGLSFKVSGDYQLIEQLTGKVIARLNREDSFQVVQKNGQLELLGKNRYGPFNGPVIVREQNFRASIVSGSGERTDRYSAKGLTVLNAEGKAVPLTAASNPTVKAASGTALISGSGGLNLVSLTCSSGTRRYRGSMELRIEKGKITAVNELNIEDYLRGVVPNEMYSTWPLEALKAQAVASRNYALQRAEATRGSVFNLSNDQSNQVYKGYDSETLATNRAVEETRGMVMLSQGSLISAFFHSSSGGYTENSEDVWTYPLPYIKWKADPYDKNGDHYNWQVKYTAQQLIEKLKTAGYEFKKIKDIKEINRTASGTRVEKIAVIGEGPPGGRVEISNADNVRRVLCLKSALFKMKKVVGKDNNLTEVTFTGNGNGHGLGMSQYGACGMAKQGYNYQDILKYYYTGITLTPNYGRAS